MKKIELTQGQFAIVDDDDFEYLSKFKWSAKWIDTTSSFAAVRSYKSSKKIYMHREVMKTPDGLVVDHINHNTLDNRKENLRNVTGQQNQMNRNAGKSKSGYKGVRINGKYIYSVITFNNQRVYIGAFKTIKEAAIAYNNKAKELFGDFANLNEVDS